MDSVQISKIIAEKIKFNVSTYLSNETLVSIETDYIANGLVAKIEWWALGREMREEVTGYYYLPTS